MASNWEKKFEQAEMAPSDALWSSVEAGLDGKAAVGPSAYMTLLAWAASFALFAASGVLTWYFALDQDTSEIGLSEELYEPPTELFIQEISPNESSKDQIAVAELDSEDQIDSLTFLPNEWNQTTSVVMEDVVELVVEDKLPEERNLVDVVIDTMTIAGSGIDSSVLNNDLVLVQETDPPVETTLDPEGLFVELTQEELGQLGLESSKERPKARFWAGVSQGFGGYAANLQSGSGLFAADEAALSENDGMFTLSESIESEQESAQSINEQAELRTSLLVGVPIAQRLSVITGFQYSRSSFTSDASSYNGELLHFTAERISVEDTETSSFQRLELQGFYEMAVIPVMMDYLIKSGRMQWSVHAGPEVALLIQQRIENDAIGTSRTTRSGDLYEPYHLRLAIGSMVSYGLSEKVYLSLQPFVEQSITSITQENASFQSYPFNYSVLFGIRYQF